MLVCLSQEGIGIRLPQHPCFFLSSLFLCICQLAFILCLPSHSLPLSLSFLPFLCPQITGDKTVVSIFTGLFSRVASRKDISFFLSFYIGSKLPEKETAELGIIIHDSISFPQWQEEIIRKEALSDNPRWDR